MNRYTILIAVLITVLASLLIAIGFVLYQRSQKSTPSVTQGSISPASFPSVPQPNTQSRESVSAALQRNMHPGEQTTMGANVVVGDWALQLWNDPHAGGEALFVYDSANYQWRLVSWGGGAWSINGLIQAGVPSNIATSLLTDLPR